MEPPDSPVVAPGRWTTLWVVALLSLLGQLGLCQFFSFGQQVPVSLDVNPSNLWKLAYHFPPNGSFQVLNWLGVAYSPQPLNPLSLAALIFSPWLFFTVYAPVVATLALLAMAAFLRELDLSRPAALFGAVIYAWQGDILPFVYPGHYGYITAWPFMALAAWAALRAIRTLLWPFAVISGACCGTMVGLLTNADRGGIACLLIASLYLVPAFRYPAHRETHLGHFILCVVVAAVIALAPLLTLFKSNIAGVKLAGATNREEVYKLVTQFSLGPAETLTYLVPGFFGWHLNHPDGPYWGWIGEWPDWPKNHQGTRNLNLAISTTGTAATVLASIGAVVVLWRGVLGPVTMPDRQRFYGRLFLALGLIALILSWGWHTGFYRPLFALPLMDKWRNPLKWLEVTNFALVVLSSIGVQHLIASLDPTQPAIQLIRRRLAWFTNAFLIVLAAALIASYPLAVMMAPLFKADDFDPTSIANIMSTMHTSLLIALVVMGLFCVVLRALWEVGKLRTVTLVNPWLHSLWTHMLKPENVPSTLALGLALLAAVQLGWVATQFIEPAPLASLTSTNPLLDALRHEGNTVRVSVATEDPVLNTFLQNQFAAMDISCLDISAASRIPDDLNTFLQNFSDDRARLWLLAGVKNVAGPEQLITQLQSDAGIAANIKNADGYTLEPTGSSDVPSHTLIAMKDYLSKATLVPQAEYFDTNEAMLKRLKDPSWNPRQSLLLAAGDKPSAGPTKKEPAKVSDNQVIVNTYTPTEIVIEVRAVNGGFVLVNDNYDSDWRVEVNGKSTRLLRADYLMRAVEIPPGESTITMRYATNYRLAGFSLPALVVNNVSDVAMVGAWLLAGLGLRRRKTGLDDTILA